MADSRAFTMGRCSTLASAAKGRKRIGSELAAEASKTLAAEETGADVVAQEGVCEEKSSATLKRKLRVSQEMIDLILAWDVSDFVFSTPDNMDDMPISEELKKKYRDDRKQAVALMQKRREVMRKMQEWAKAELAKNGGYIEIETTAEVLEKHQLEEYIARLTS